LGELKKLTPFIKLNPRIKIVSDTMVKIPTLVSFEIFTVLYLIQS